MQNENSVCFVAEIGEMKPIPGADRIVHSLIGGWECVLQKEGFKQGDRVVIAVTDAVIPEQLADKLNIKNFLKHRKKANVYTVKTVKLKGVYSSATILEATTEEVGTDMEKKFGISKYEEELIEQVIYDKNGKPQKRRFQKNPNFHIYHKFPNVKNVTGMFTPEDDIIVTQKIHGTNARYGVLRKSKTTLVDHLKRFWYNLTHQYDKALWLDYEFVYGSHQVQKGSDTQGYYSTDVWKEVLDKYNLKELLWDAAKKLGKVQLGEGIIIYGEIYGPGIQKYYDYGHNERVFSMFDVKVNGEYLSHLDMAMIAYNLGITICPVLYFGKYDEEKIKATYMNKFINKTDVPEEGVVVKDKMGSRTKCAKFINPAYLAFQSKKEDSTDFH